MRASKKYKGKYTKKRLKNIVRGQTPFGIHSYFIRSDYIYLAESRVAFEWWLDNKITHYQFTQWGY